MRPVEVHRLVLFEEKTPSIARIADVLAQQALEIVAVAASADEGVGPVAVALAPQPGGEVVRLVREGAHVGDADVEEMVGVRGPIGAAPPELWRTLHQPHDHFRIGMQQVDGGEQPAETAADHGDSRG